MVRFLGGRFDHYVRNRAVVRKLKLQGADCVRNRTVVRKLGVWGAACLRNRAVVRILGVWGAGWVRHRTAWSGNGQSGPIAAGVGS